MIELHDRGRTLDDIDRCLQMAPIEPEMESAIKLAAACGWVARNRLPGFTYLTSSTWYFVLTGVSHFSYIGFSYPSSFSSLPRSRRILPRNRVPSYYKLFQCEVYSGVTSKLSVTPTPTLSRLYWIPMAFTSTSQPYTRTLHTCLIVAHCVFFLFILQMSCLTDALSAHPICVRYGSGQSWGASVMSQNHIRLAVFSGFTLSFPRFPYCLTDMLRNTRSAYWSLERSHVQDIAFYAPNCLCL